MADKTRYVAPNPPPDPLAGLLTQMQPDIPSMPQRAPAPPAPPLPTSGPREQAVYGGLQDVLARTPEAAQEIPTGETDIFGRQAGMKMTGTQGAALRRLPEVLAPAREQDLMERGMRVKEMEAETPRLMPGLQAEAEISKAFGMLPAQRQAALMQHRMALDLSYRTQRLVEHLPIVMQDFLDPTKSPEEKEALMAQLTQAWGVKMLPQFMQALPMLMMGLSNVPQFKGKEGEISSFLLMALFKHVPGFAQYMQQFQPGGTLPGGGAPSAPGGPGLLGTSPAPGMAGGSTGPDWTRQFNSPFDFLLGGPSGT